MSTNFPTHSSTRMHRWQPLFAIVGIASGLAGAPWSAGAAVLATFDQVTAIEGLTGFCSGPSGAVASIQHSGTASVADIRCLGPGFAGTASGRSEFGALHAQADLNFNQFKVDPPATRADFEAKVRSGYSDSLLFSAGAATWRVTVGVSGQSVIVRDGIAHETNVGWCFNLLGGACSSNGAIVANIGVATFDIRIPQNGILEINPTLIIDLNAGFTDNNSPTTVDVFANLSDTAKFLGSQVLDANGNPIGGAKIVADSGFDYIGAAVPEPAPIAGLAIGLAGLFGIRRTARRG